MHSCCFLVNFLLALSLKMLEKYILFFRRQGVSSSFLLIFSVLIASVIVCVAVVAIYACSLPSASKEAFSTLFMVAVSSYTVGNILGLIFGIPKTVQDQTGKTSQQKKLVYHVNTSLEQISDWLTKMIIGAGLVELKDLTVFLVSISKKIAEDIAHEQAQSIIIASILCFFILGFFVTYLSTRLYIANALVKANAELQETSEEKPINS